ncbi:hypothetical protein SASPL_135361 [Salvia splendens]|uniref:Uncharacterized protein n=1 Tax=Salvia splendens TaxID=180675 RepID=A0A8X8WYN0_SALSN|nr:hypothetical protein SASPL_135361 [Salvia splendens]
MLTPMWSWHQSKKMIWLAAYYYVGDPEYARLRLLSGPQEIKQESAPLVITISDPTVPVEDLNLMFKPSGGVGLAPSAKLNVSVSSPPMPKVPKMKTQFVWRLLKKCG